MNATTAVFYAFAAVLLLAAFRVITARNTVHAALWLVLAFFNAACVWMLLEAEFLSISLVLVYVGAVMVLFLFVVMMLDINTDQLRAGFWKRFPFVGVVGLVIVLEMAIVLRGGFDVAAPVAPAAAVAGGSNTRQLGIELFTMYLYPLQIAGVLLLVAIISAIALTLRERKDSKALDPSVQLKARKADRVRLVRMEAERPAPPVAAPGTAPGVVPVVAPAVGATAGPSSTAPSAAPAPAAPAKGGA